MPRSREKEFIRQIFDAGGIADDATLMVHSSFRELSRAGHRAEDFAAGMLDALPRGTLLMPVMTWRTVTPENPVFDELATPSHTGVLTEVFRLQLATARSIHPTHSTAAAGCAANTMVAAHHFGTTPCSPESPFGRLADIDAYILLLGCDFERCTAIHCEEERFAPDLYLRPLDSAVVYSCRDRHGVTHKVHARRHWKLDRDFVQFGDRMRALGLLTAGRLDKTVWQLFRARDLRDVLQAAFRETPEATIRVSSRAGKPMH